MMDEQEKELRRIFQSPVGNIWKLMRTVREKKTTCRRGNFDSSEDSSGMLECLARKVK